MARRYHLVIVFLFFGGLFNPISSQANQEKSKEKFEERTYTYVERELEYLMTIWSGEYDNVEQLDFDSQAGNKGTHFRVHSFVKPLEKSQFGAYAVYVETYMDDDPNKIRRQVIYQLSANETSKTIKLIPCHFVNPKPYLSVGSGIVFLQNMKRSSNLLKKGCEMRMKREGMSFEGSTVNKKCIIDNQEKNLSSDYQIKISEKGFWFREVQYDSGKEVRLPDDQQLSYYRLEKARCFVCMIDFPNKTNGRPTVTKYYIPIHDQGGKFEFDYPEGRHMVLGMRNTWSFGMQRETFVIFIQEGSQKGKTLIYSWGNPGADRIGFNPGWIRVQCDLDTPKNRKLQKGLRPDS